MVVSDSELEAVDGFIKNRSKVLDGPQPEWQENGYGDYQVAWPIKEADTGVIRSGLRLRIPYASYENPSIGVVFRKRMIARLDRAKPSICEPNPPYAQKLGLPYRVCGPHIHNWPDNRPHIALSGHWELPARRPITDNMTRMNQMFFWFCDEIHVTIPTDYRTLHMPDQNLFGPQDA